MANRRTVSEPDALRSGPAFGTLKPMEGQYQLKVHPADATFRDKMLSGARAGDEQMSREALRCDDPMAGHMSSIHASVSHPMLHDDDEEEEPHAGSSSGRKRKSDEHSHKHKLHKHKHHKHEHKEKHRKHKKEKVHREAHRHKKSKHGEKEKDTRAGHKKSSSGSESSGRGSSVGIVSKE